MTLLREGAFDMEALVPWLRGIVRDTSVLASDQRAEIDQPIEYHQQCSRDERQEWGNGRPPEDEHRCSWLGGW